MYKTKNHLIIILLFVPNCLICSQACSPVASYNNPARLSHNIDIQNIRKLTDNLLIALTSHNYHSITPLLDDQSNATTGKAAAWRLLGHRAFQVFLDRWDATKISVTFDKDPHWATSSVVVFYKFVPNRKSLSKVFTFRFHRLRPEMPWRLFVP